MKYIFSFLLLAHGAIHLIGFLKAFDLADIQQLTADISRVSATFWFVVFVLFTASGIAFIFKFDWWFMPAMVASIISTVLVIMFWKDAKFGY